MENFTYSIEFQSVINQAEWVAKQQRHQFVQPEHLLFGVVREMQRWEIPLVTLSNPYNIEMMLTRHFQTMERVPENINHKPEYSVQTIETLEDAKLIAKNAGWKEIYTIHWIKALFDQEDSYASYFLHLSVVDNEAEFLSELGQTSMGHGSTGTAPDLDDLDDDDEDTANPLYWQQLVTCMNDNTNLYKPLIGREAELERTIQVLCRKDKNNPLYVGEPGVGKTALVQGLVSRIAAGDMPEKLKNCRVYQMDMGTMLAGTQFRGDFEKRIKMVMDGLEKEGFAIVYLDEIHNVIGAGRGTEGPLDASNMLLPYFERGNIRFIGATTYEEYNRYMARNRSITRRFQQIDVPEPSVEDTIAIIKGLQEIYEVFHQVTYTDEAIDYAVRQSAKLLTDRFLPDKAIDLIDEAGAYRALHPLSTRQKDLVDKPLIAEILTKLCKIDAAALTEESNEALETLEQRMSAQVFGQQEAVRQVVEAIQMAKAGLRDDDKPMASLLFVGPTGVGKTEVARTLAHELGIPLVRFDMSEYVEKHAVAKLIGSPAGYVGYEDGGLLTDAVRKSPNCVLLLDEIEKAHQDIYNILLQVMDYARLTDNRGQKADFRNVVLIMTSNAGAQYASQASVGFTGRVSRGEAMLSQVRKTFKPEFLNRLSGTVVFNDMSMEMASLILDKKLGELNKRLEAKQVKMTLEADARAFLLKEGRTHEYGARELDRVIARHLKPLLMREILFGRLKKGGEATITANDHGLSIR